MSSPPLWGEVDALKLVQASGDPSCWHWEDNGHGPVTPGGCHSTTEAVSPPTTDLTASYWMWTGLPMSALLGDYFKNLQMLRFASNRYIGICTNAQLVSQRMSGQGNTLLRVGNTFQFRASPYCFCLSFLHCILVNASTPWPPLLLPSLTATEPHPDSLNILCQSSLPLLLTRAQ